MPTSTWLSLIAIILAAAGGTAWRLRKQRRQAEAEHKALEDHGDS